VSIENRENVGCLGAALIIRYFPGPTDTNVAERFPKAMNRSVSPLKPTSLGARVQNELVSRDRRLRNRRPPLRSALHRGQASFRSGQKRVEAGQLRGDDDFGPIAKLHRDAEGIRDHVVALERSHAHDIRPLRRAVMTPLVPYAEARGDDDDPIRGVHAPSLTPRRCQKILIGAR
jgi:hypothetical protein